MWQNLYKNDAWQNTRSFSVDVYTQSLYTQSVNASFRRVYIHVHFGIALGKHFFSESLSMTTKNCFQTCVDVIDPLLISGNMITGCFCVTVIFHFPQGCFSIVNQSNRYMPPSLFNVLMLSHTNRKLWLYTKRKAHSLLWDINVIIFMVVSKPVKQSHWKSGSRVCGWLGVSMYSRKQQKMDANLNF